LRNDDVTDAAKAAMAASFSPSNNKISASSSKSVSVESLLPADFSKDCKFRVADAVLVVCNDDVDDNDMETSRRTSTSQTGFFILAAVLGFFLLLLLLLSTLLKDKCGIVSIAFTHQGPKLG
jgi:hypothetical protein